MLPQLYLCQVPTYTAGATTDVPESSIVTCSATPGGGRGGAAALGGRGALGPRACQTKRPAAEPNGPPPPGFQGASRPAAAPGPLELPPPPKRATQSPAPRSMGPGTPIHGRKRRGNGPAPWGKAAAHALRAAAAQPAPPRAAAPRRPHSLLREYRRPRRAAARVGPRGRCCRWFCR